MDRVPNALPILLAGVLAASSAAGDETATRPRRGPDLVVLERVHDFGTISQDEMVTHRFRFRNAGDELLRLQVPRHSCGCIVAPLAKLDYLPGEEAVIDATFNPAHKLGLQAVTVTLLSNDPEEPAVELRLSGVVVADIVIQPPNLYFYNVRHGEGARQEIHIRDRQGLRLRVTGLEVTDPQGLAVAWREAEPRPTGAVPGSPGVLPAQPGSEAVLTVEIRPERRPGPLQEKLRFQIDGRTATIDVHGEILGSVTVTPGYFYLGQVEPGKSASASVVVASDRPGFAVRGAQCTHPGVEVRIVQDGASPRFTVTATLREGWSGPALSGLVQIATNDDLEPVKEVHLVGLVRPPR